MLDDYHHIHNTEVHKLIGIILHFSPQNLHLAILTRRDPPLDLVGLRSHERMAEIRMQELSFSESEIKTLFRKVLNLDLSSENSRLLLEKTEGWIVRIRLALHAIKNQEDADRIIKQLKGNFFAISEFLLEEVLERKPAEVQDLMLNISILDSFCVPLIEETFKVQGENKAVIDGNAFVQWLLKSNLFVIQMDMENHWFRYHHLLQELLNMQLEKKVSIKQIAGYHIKASQWFESSGFIEKAIRHALAGGDMERGVRIVEEQRYAILEDDEWSTLDSWLDMLPEILKIAFGTTDGPGLAQFIQVRFYKYIFNS